MFFLFTNIETNCWTIQNMERTVVFWFTLVYAIHVLQCLHAIVDIMPIIRKPQRFWYLKPWDTVSSWTFLYIELCWLWVIFLFAIPEIYYDDSLGAFLWGDLDHDQWSKITHMVHQMNWWIRDQRGFISSFYAPVILDHWSWSI